MNLWDKCLVWAEKMFVTSRIFKRVFDLKNNDTLIVLGNLQEFCGADNLNLRLDKNGDIPPCDLARRAGRLEVYQHIAKYLSMTEEQKNQVANIYYQHQVKQQKQDIYD